MTGENGLIINNEVRDSLSSVEIKQTSKGTNITVKVYNPDPKVAEEKASEIFKNLKKLHDVVVG